MGAASRSVPISPERTRTRRWVPSFVALSAIWGSSFSLIKVAVDAGITPLWVAFFRCALGAATLWLLLVAHRQRVPLDRWLWTHAAVAAVLLNSLPFTLIAYGEGRVSSVLAGVLTASTPLFTFGAVMLSLPEERPNAGRLAGLVAGFVGVLVVIDVGRGVGTGHVLGSVAVLGAAACYGAGFVYTRRFLSGRPESGTTLSTVQITVAALQLGAVAFIAGAQPTWPGGPVVIALVALGTLGTGVAYVLNFAVIRGAGPTVASTITYIVPLWSTALGALLLAEGVGWRVAVGGLVITCGVALSRTRVPPPGPDAAAGTPAGRFSVRWLSRR